jgi:hypothetical protein
MPDRSILGQEKCIRFLALDTFRIFTCGGCQSILMICRRCDRGQVYCARCRVEARHHVKKRARLRHMQSAEGRADHVDRQRAYRRRRSRRVMDPGIEKLAISASVFLPDLPGAATVAIAQEELGTKGENATEDDDTKARNDTANEAMRTLEVQLSARPRRVTCMACGALGRTVREHFLRRGRQRRGVQAITGMGSPASARSG